MTKAQDAINAAQSVTNAHQEARIDAVEQAIVQINHFTEAIEGLELAEWKGYVTGRIDLMTYFMGATMLAVISGVVKLLFFP